MTTAILQFHTPKRLFWVLVFGIVLTIAGYIFAMFSTTMAIVMWENVETGLATKSAQVSELEFDYISLKNSITIDVAYERGFVDVDDSLFLARNEGGNLSLNTGE